jgi:hypothetical protein
MVDLCVTTYHYKIAVFNNIGPKAASQIAAKMMRNSPSRLSSKSHRFKQVIQRLKEQKDAVVDIKHGLLSLIESLEQFERSKLSLNILGQLEQLASTMETTTNKPRIKKKAKRSRIARKTAGMAIQTKTVTKTETSAETESANKTEKTTTEMTTNKTDNTTNSTDETSTDSAESDDKKSNVVATLPGIIAATHADGHCLLHAVGLCLDHLNLSVSYDELRHKLAVEVQEHKPHYEPFYTGDDFNQEFIDYVLDKKYNTSMGDLILPMLLNALDLTADVFEKNEDGDFTWTSLKPSREEVRSDHSIRLLRSRKEVKIRAMWKGVKLDIPIEIAHYEAIIPV